MEAIYCNTQCCNIPLAGKALEREGAFIKGGDVVELDKACVQTNSGEVPCLCPGAS